MSLAMAYAMKRKAAKHKAHGGEMCAHGKTMCEMCHGGEYADGGPVEKSEHSSSSNSRSEGYSHEMLNPVTAIIKHKGKWIDSVGPQNIDKAIRKHREEHANSQYMADGGFVEEEKASGMEDMPEDEEDDMVGRIMEKRSGHYSEGGQVANDTPPMADSEENEFDDLVKDDDLEEHYTGENSGDEIGDHQEDEDRHDIISRIMMSRRKKDRNPRPA